MAQNKNQYLGYTFKDNALILEWKLKPNQSYTTFQRVAVRKTKEVMNYLFSTGELDPKFKTCSYNVEIEDTYKFIIEHY